MPTPLSKKWIARFLKKYSKEGLFEEDRAVLSKTHNFYHLEERKKGKITDMETLMQKYAYYIPQIDLGRENRFRALDTPLEVQGHVKKTIHGLLGKEESIQKEPKKSKNIFVFLKETIAFSTTTIIIFLVLLLGVNFDAYSQVTYYWWDTISGKNQKVTANLEKLAKVDELAKETSKETLPLRLPTIEKELDSSKPPSLDIAIPIYPPDNRIVIPKIGQNIPIQEVPLDNLINENWQALEDEIQKSLEKGVVRYPGTAVPGQIGNVFITGHSSYYVWSPGKYKDTFALLHNLEIGDSVIVYYNENKYTYTIEERKVVQPNQVDVLKQSEDRRLTLMTCTPIGTALNRLILTAKQN